jgi:hypothetical protein
MCDFDDSFEYKKPKIEFQSSEIEPPKNKIKPSKIKRLKPTVYTLKEKESKNGRKSNRGDTTIF